MPEEMGVPWDLASTTMEVVLGDATQVFAGPQSWDGGQPPQVPPQPSSPQVSPVQLGLQLARMPESGAPSEGPESATLVVPESTVPPVVPESARPPEDTAASAAFMPTTPGEHAAVPKPMIAASAIAPTMVVFLIQAHS